MFANVRNDMTIAREEIFGPVITILPYRNEAEVVNMANDTVYGLAAYVQSSDIKNARRLAGQMRAGNVHLNYPAGDNAAPFGGYKQSGNGREYGKWGLEEFLEVKAVIGTRPRNCVRRYRRAQFERGGQRPDCRWVRERRAAHAPFAARWCRRVPCDATGITSEPSGRCCLCNGPTGPLVEFRRTEHPPLVG